MPRYLIDSQGRVWDPFDDQLLLKLGDPDPDYDLVSYAVRNLGFIDVLIGDAAVGTTIRIRELAVTAPALFAASDLIARVSLGPITIISGTDNWSERHFEGADDAVAWLQERTNADVLSTGFSDIAVVSQDIGRLSNRRLNALEQNDDRLALLFKKWRISSGRFSYETTQFMVNFGLLDRATLAYAADAGSLVWQHVGQKLNLYERDDRAWHLTLVGRPIDEQNDKNYGAFIQNSFRQSIVRNEPRLDHVDAVIRNRRGSHRSRYNRLVLPWEADDGTKIISTLSYKTDDDMEFAT